MARSKRASDEAYNARRRYRREAARLQKQAEKASGSYSERLRELSDKLLDKANMTYQAGTGSYRTDLIKESNSVRSMSEERQTDILLSSNIGSRIYAGTIELWQDADPNEREDAILRAFGVKSMLDVLKILERELGERLYSDDTRENYMSVVLAIQSMMA